MRTLDLDTDGPYWPTRERGRIVRAGGLAGFVVQDGPPDAPEVLLLHGVAGTTHCFALLIPLLARHFRVTAIDLPGHGFTEVPEEAGLRRAGMVGWIHALLRELGSSPALLAGHSAGAGIAIELAVEGEIEPAAIIGVNPSLVQPRNVPLAGPLAAWGAGLMPDRVVASLLARLARTEVFVDQVLRSTGSTLPPGHRECYLRISRSPAQVQSAIRMMIGWAPHDLLGQLRNPAVSLPPVTLVAGTRDRWIPPQEVRRAARSFPTPPRLIEFDEGHLGPEGSPERVAEIVLEVAERTGVLPR